MGERSPRADLNTRRANGTGRDYRPPRPARPGGDLPNPAQRWERAERAYAAETAPSFLVSGISSGAVMQHVAQPNGTPAALAVLNRGEDPLLIAHIIYAFFIACKAMLHPKPIEGNHLSVQHSSVVGLIGQFFIVTDPAVLHTMESGAYLDAAALTSLKVAFLVSLGTDLLK